MILFVEGVARQLPTHEWLEFLDKRTFDADASPYDHGWEVGPLLGDVSSLDFSADYDRWSDVLVTEDGRAIALSADQWLAYLSDQLDGETVPVAEYGSDQGPVAPPLDALSPIVAKILAAGLRASLVAEYECPGPVEFAPLLEAIAA